MQERATQCDRVLRPLKTDLKSAGSNSVGVRVPLWAPHSKRLTGSLDGFRLRGGDSSGDSSRETGAVSRRY
jgi:hypothetical protein